MPHLATFAGGCFWCMVAPFENINGVEQVTSGYTGGHIDNPSYEQVCSGATGHLEAIQIEFDPGKVSYVKLVDTFWQQIDPTDAEGSFFDRGNHYQSAIFYHSDMQKEQAQYSKDELEKSTRFPLPIATKILTFESFYPAELYHQNYHKKNPEHYLRYRQGSGRDVFIKKHWKPPTS